MLALTRMNATAGHEAKVDILAKNICVSVETCCGFGHGHKRRPLAEIPSLCETQEWICGSEPPNFNFE